MTLQDDLARRRREIRAALSDAEARTLEAALERLRMLQIAEHAPAIGDPFPDFELEDASGTAWRSEALLACGPLVVAFFRGGWCPYCDLALRAMERVRTELEALGVGLVGIVAERPEILARTAAERDVRFPLLVDRGGRLAGLCGLRFELTPEHVRFYVELGVDLAASQAELGWELPIPACFLLAPDATIVHVFADADWTRRVEPATLVAAARGLLAEDGAARG